MNGLFVNIGGITHEAHVSLFDEDEDDDTAVWLVIIGDQHIFVEGHVDDEIWSTLDRAVGEYEM